MAEKKLIIEKKKYRGKSAVVSCRLPEEMIQAIDQAAEETGYNRNEILNLCIQFALDNLEMK